ncbi:hypothetical protein SAMN04487970_1001284 [Paenibacillus tianmuensis]|uniref:Uncharacterized protein n=1 Tax=Paenibacillus tianmuensis TaxID=624147 RepID=A0A1G4P987_9BACL|nr:hypothetical protein [Paenibacillus tianmuensis]SCW28782.1 hypothetical protein SAMN04487970_1001284 [Paenibacillus tianmuensis]
MGTSERFKFNSRLPFDPGLLKQEYAIDIDDQTLIGLSQYQECWNMDEYVYRILTTEEIGEMLDFLRDLACHRGICPLLTDDQSNNIGLYTEGPLRDKICYLDHEETDLSPGFRHMERFIAKCLQHPGAEWDQLERDYPVVSDRDEQHEHSVLDLKVIQEIDRLLLQEDLDEDYTRQLVFSKLTIMPYAESEQICRYVTSDDMFIQEKAVILLRKRNYTAAAHALFEVAQHGMHNGRMAAIFALKQFRTEESKRLLKELETLLPKQYF